MRLRKKSSGLSFMKKLVFVGSKFDNKVTNYNRVKLGFSGAPTIGPDLGVSGCFLGRATLRSAGRIGRWRSIRCRFSPRLPPVRLWQR